jgi:hypothetical protein
VHRINNLKSPFAHLFHDHQIFYECFLSRDKRPLPLPFPSFYPLILPSVLPSACFAVALTGRIFVTCYIGSVLTVFRGNSSYIKTVKISVTLYGGQLGFIFTGGNNFPYKRSIWVKLHQAVRPSSANFSFCPHTSARFRLDDFTWNVIFGMFMKICGEIPNLVKIAQRWKPKYVLLLGAPFNRHKSALFGW